MERVSEIMENVDVFCSADTPLKTVAKLLRKYHRGKMPIVSNEADKIILGVLSTKDLTYRSLGRGLNPLELTAEDCMTSPAIVAQKNMDLAECYELMKKHDLKMLPVQDEHNAICGVIYREDIEEKLSYLH